MFTNLPKRWAVGIVTLSLVAGLVAPSTLPTRRALAQSPTVTELQAQIASLLTLIQQLQVQLTNLGGDANTGLAAGMPESFLFSRNLTIGSRGTDVMYLQRFLNNDPSTILAQTGAGSPGLESQYFGPITRNAVMRFQTKYAASVLSPLGLLNATSFWGPSSVRHANSLLIAARATPPLPPPDDDDPPPPPPPPSPPAATLSIAATGDMGLRPIPRNVSGANFGDFTLSAGSKEVRIDSITILRSGLGSRQDFDDVWLLVNGIRHGSPRSFISGDIAIFSFAGSPIVISANSNKTLSIMASMSDNVSSNQFNQLGISAISSNRTVLTPLPLLGPQTITSSQGATELTITAQGSDQTVSVGGAGVELGRFRVDIQSQNDQAIILREITFENEGTVSRLSDVIENVKLRAGGQTISSETRIDNESDRITFLFGANGFRIEDGQSLSLTIIADIRSAEVGDTIRFKLDESFDIVAHDVGSQVGVRVIGIDAGGTTNPASNVDLRTYAIQTGRVNFSIANASSRSVPPGMDDVILLDGKLTVGAAFRADGLLVRLGSGTAAGSNTVADVNAVLENVTLRIDGISIDTVDTITNASGGANAEAFVVGSSGDYYNFDSTFQVESGVHTMRVEADIKSAAATASKVRLQAFASDLDSAEYLATGDNIPSGEISGQVSGSIITIENATLTANRNDGFSGETLTGGSQNVFLMRFLLTANSSSDVNVNSLTFDLNESASTYEEANINNLRLFVEGVEVGSPTDLSNGTFSSANFTVPRSGQAQIAIMADTTASDSSRTLRIDLVNVDASDTQGNDVTVNRSTGGEITSANPLSSDTFTIDLSGGFTLTIDGDTPDEAILVGDGGALWYSIATYRLSAEDEDVRLTDLYLVNTTDLLDATLIDTGTDARVQTLGLFDENGVLKGSKALSIGRVEFNLGSNTNQNGLGAIVVPRDSFTKVTVRAKLNSVVDADKTGKLLRLALATDRGTANTGVVVESSATGADLGASAIVASRTGDTGVIRATSTLSDMFAIRRSEPKIAIVAQTSGDRTLTNGSNRALLRFTVSANANEDIAWKGIKFDVDGRFGGSALATTTTASSFVITTSGGSEGLGINSSTANLSRFQLIDTATGSEVSGGNYAVHLDFDEVGNNGEIAIVLADTRESVVAAGSSKTYELRASISGVSSSGDFVDVTLDDEADDNRANSSYLVSGTDPDEVDQTADGLIRMTANSATSPYGFLWSDFSGSPHDASDNNSSAASRDWTNDRFLQMDTSSWNRSSSF